MLHKVCGFVENHQMKYSRLENSENILVIVDILL